jgi:hypothetical protein
LFLTSAAAPALLAVNLPMSLCQGDVLDHNDVGVTVDLLELQDKNDNTRSNMTEEIDVQQLNDGQLVSYVVAIQGMTALFL